MLVQPRKEKGGAVCQPEKVLGQRAVFVGTVAASVGTTAVATVSAAAAAVESDGPYDDDAARRNYCSGGVISMSPSLGGALGSFTGLLLL